MVSCKDVERDELMREVGKEQYQETFTKLRQDSESLSGFSDWGEVVAFLRRGSAKDPGKDAVLLSIVKSHGKSEDPRWRTVLLLIFWPGILSICRKRRRLDEDAEELLQTAVCAFLRALVTLDTSCRHDHIVRRIMNATTHRLYEEYERTGRHAGSLIPTDPDELDDLVGTADDAVFIEAERRMRMGAYVGHLRQQVLAGRISQADCELLTATRLEGKSAAQYARDNAMPVEAVRKRRLRAEAAMRAPTEALPEKTCPVFSARPACCVIEGDVNGLGTQANRQYRKEI